jgi:hypothetical protein
LLFRDPGFFRAGFWCAGRETRHCHRKRSAAGTGWFHNSVTKCFGPVQGGESLWCHVVPTLKDRLEAVHQQSPSRNDRLLSGFEPSWIIRTTGEWSWRLDTGESIRCPEQAKGGVGTCSVCVCVCGLTERSAGQ